MGNELGPTGVGGHMPLKATPTSTLGPDAPSASCKFLFHQDALPDGD